MIIQPEPQITKKIYFIKKGKPGHEITTLLKNKFKSLDAIRDILDWFDLDKNFYVSLTDWAPEMLDIAPRTVSFGPVQPSIENHKNLRVIVQRIINWLDEGRDFDITLSPKDPFVIHMN